MNKTARRLMILAASIVSIINASAQSRQGTGVAINPDGDIITNRHIVQNSCGILTVEDLSGNRWRAEIRKVSRRHDLALLRSSRRGAFAYIRVNDSQEKIIDPTANESVHIVGFPGGEFAPRGGFVKTLKDPLHGNDGFSVGLQSTYGGSGSPVFDEGGLLIGLLWGGARDVDSLTVYALKASAFKEILSEVRVGTASRAQSPVPVTARRNAYEQAMEVGATGASSVLRVICTNP